MVTWSSDGRGIMGLIDRWRIFLFLICSQTNDRGKGRRTGAIMEGFQRLRNGHISTNFECERLTDANLLSSEMACFHGKVGEFDCTQLTHLSNKFLPNFEHVLS